MFKALELTWLLLVLLSSCQFSLELKSNLAKAFLLILYCSRQGAIPLCQEGHEVQSYYKPLVSCISGTMSKRWTPIQDRSSSSQWNSSKLEVHGKYCSIIFFFSLHLLCVSSVERGWFVSECITIFMFVGSAKTIQFCVHFNDFLSPTILIPFFFAGVQPDDFFEDLQVWRSALKNYWSLLTPLIFSDHPKRPGDEDPLPPFNMIRNVIDMSAHYGGLNAAFLEEKKSVWVMNVVPVNAPYTLPLILDQGFAGVLHDW